MRLSMTALIPLMAPALAMAALLPMTAIAQEAPATSVEPPPEAVAGTPVSAPEMRTVQPENLLVIDTTKGRILVEMAPEVAPLHVERVRLLARNGFYDGIPWHRVIDNFMAQTGDPLGNGEGQSAYPDLTAEFTFRRGTEMPFVAVTAPAGAQVGFLRSLPVVTQPDANMATTADGKVHGWGVYCPGVAGMARDDDNDSANSQFFLMRQPYPSLDKRYTVWGVAVSGLDVVRAMKVGEGDGGMVVEPDRMTRVRVASDIAEAERPVVQILDPASAAFRTLADQARTTRGADFSICDVELPVQVSGVAPAA